jgi:hypothetical protein
MRLKTLAIPQSGKNDVMNDKQFLKLAQNKFHFLIKEFMFKEPKFNVDSFGYYLEYRNATTGIKIEYETREQYINVNLYRLIAGEFPQFEIDKECDNGFSVDDVATLRVNNCIVSQAQSINNLTNKQVEQILDGYRIVLSESAKDIMNGDFSIFSDLRTMALTRLRESH